MWEAFWTFHNARPPGFDGPARISFETISLYALATRMSDPAQFLPFVRMIQALDRALIDYLHKKQDAKSKPKPSGDQ